MIHVLQEARRDQVADRLVDRTSFSRCYERAVGNEMKMSQDHYATRFQHGRGPGVNGAIAFGASMCGSGL